MISKLIFHIVILPLMTGFCTAGFSQEIRVLTYNIRFDNPEDGENRWDQRKDKLAGLLHDHDPDIFGIQEGLFHQVKYIDSALAVYGYLGQGRDDGKIAGEFCAIFFKESAFTLLKQGIFWLSETPQIPSVGWDAALNRICVYGLFEHRKSNHRFFVFNTHLDHVGKMAREKSVALIVTRVNEINREDLPVIILGDFNLEPGDGALIPALNHYYDARSACTGDILGPAGTFNAFRFDLPVIKRLDYIFSGKGKSEVLKYEVITDSVDGLYPSDHLPVFVTVKLK